jgi:tetratricopeptide (TPR) repeat protein
LAGFLRAFGVPGQDIPPEPDQRGARYRSMLAGRRVLVVLDNAGSAEQVRPLLPGAPGCVVVVTSRDALAGLVARDGATRVELGALPLADAVSLLQALIPARVDAEPQSATDLAGYCCRLPLPLRIAAELVTARPDAPLASLVGELADQQRRLDLLDSGGDPRTAIRAVFSWSNRHLDAATGRAFRLLALYPGPDFDSYDAAALSSSSLEQAGRILSALTRAHLIHPAGAGRHVMHDLLRTYGAELAANHDSDDDRRAAMTRLLDYYLHTAAAAMDTLYPAQRHRRPHISRSVSLVPPVGEPGMARAWLDTHRPSMLAAVRGARDYWPGHVTMLAATLFLYLEKGGHFPEAIIIHGHAAAAACHAGDQTAEATALSALGLAYLHQSRCGQARGHFEQALARFRMAGDRTGEARVLGYLGNANFDEGYYRQAASDYREALALHRSTPDRYGEAIVLANLSLVSLRLGLLREARDGSCRALVLAREIGDRNAESYALKSLGLVNYRQGCYQKASDFHLQALELFREAGDLPGEGYALTSLGMVDLRLGDCQQAIHRHQQALVLFRKTGDRSGEAEALNGLGEAWLAVGQPGTASAQHATAVEVASRIGDRYQQARAHNGLADVHHATGESGQALRHLQEAFISYISLGTPEASEVRARLARARSDAR